MHAIRLADYQDTSALSAMLARAFDKDPLWRWIAGSQAGHELRLARAFATQLRHLALPGGLVWTGTEYQGAALWSEPGRWRLGILQQLRLMPEFVQVTGWRRLWEVVRAIDAVQRAHPTTPHYYLQVLGVDPLHQGQGWSRTFLETVLVRCDQQSLPAYLETAQERNLSLYRRFGFDVSLTLTDLPGKAPPLWCMWRPPATTENHDFSPARCL